MFLSSVGLPAVIHLTLPPLEKRSVPAILDLNKPSTLVIPQILDTNFSRGSTRELIGRTSLSGVVHALLENIQVYDYSERMFSYISFESESFDIWQNGLQGGGWNQTKLDGEHPSEQVPDIIVSDLGTIKISKGLQRQFVLPNSLLRRQYYTITMYFEPLKSLEEVIDVVPSFEQLLGFLIGWRPKLPAFHLIARCSGAANSTGTLDIGYLEHHQSDRPNHFTSGHLRAIDNADLTEILHAFYSDRGMIIAVIHCVEKIRFFSSYVVDNFKLTAPVLEYYLQQKYKNAEQASYLNVRDRFFEYVDASDDQQLMDFSKKHLKVVGQKSLSLKELLVMAIAELNSEGFSIEAEMAARINLRRGSLFHSPGDVNDLNITDIYDETLAMAAILMLLTFKQLGLSLSEISKRVNAFTDLRRVCSKDRPTFLTQDDGTS